MLVAKTSFPDPRPSEVGCGSSREADAHFQRSRNVVPGAPGIDAPQAFDDTSYRDVLKARLTPHIGALPVDRVTPIVIRELDGSWSRAVIFDRHRRQNSSAQVDQKLGRLSRPFGPQTRKEEMAKVRGPKRGREDRKNRSRAIWRPHYEQ